MIVFNLIHGLGRLFMGDVKSILNLCLQSATV